MNSYITKKGKKCSHKIITEKLTIKSRAYFYCYKCGKLIIVKDLKIYEALNKGKFEFNPIKMINQMIIKQKEEIKIIKEKFFKNNFNNNNDKFMSNIYVKNRDIFISYLKKFCNKMNYSENTFYHCLYLLDSYLIHILKKEISKRTIVLITLGFFLISSKFTESDIYEPNINKFCKIDKEIVISQSEILNMEIKCLQIINYNILNYSVYDWIKIFNKVGIVFDTETVNLKIDQIYEKQKYLLKRIIDYNILYRYNSFQVALSIIHITMDNLFSINRINKDLFELFLSIFSYKFCNYEQCYTDIKNYIFNYNSKPYNEKNDDNNEKQNENYNKTESDKRILGDCYNKSVEYILKHPIHISNINKSQSKNMILYLNDNIYKNKNKSEKAINMLRNKTDSEQIKIKNKINNFDKKNKEEYKSSDFSSFILSKEKLLFKKEKQHLTIDCNNIETIKNNKNNYLNYNNIINFLLKKTKNNNSYRDIFNKGIFLNKDKNSRNNINDKITNKNSVGNILNKIDFKKSLSSLSNSPFKKKEQLIKENNFSLLYDFNNHKEKNLLKKLNINMSNKNLMEANKSLKTFYMKNPVKTYILKNDSIFSSSNDWKKEKNVFLRNNNINNLKNKNEKFINKEIMPHLRNGIIPNE